MGWVLIFPLATILIPIWLYGMMQYFKKPPGWQWRFLASIVLFFAIGRLAMWAIDAINRSSL